MPLDKLTWLKKKLGFDVDAAKAKKKAAAGVSAATAPAAPPTTAIIAAASMATTAGVANGTGWQGATKSADVTAAAGFKMGGNRQTVAPPPPPPPPPPPLPNGGYTPVLGLPTGESSPYLTTEINAEGGYAPVEGLPTGESSPYLTTDINPEGGYAPPEGLPKGEMSPYLITGDGDGGYTPDLDLRQGDGLAYLSTTGVTPETPRPSPGNPQIYSTMDQAEDGLTYTTDPEFLNPEAPPPPNITMDKTPAKKFDTVDASNTDYAQGVEGATGMKGKSVGSEYTGEHNEAGWRDKIWGVKKDDTGITTKLNTEEERAKGTLKLQEDGTYTKSDGSSLPEDESIGYAMDPKTGEMATFSDGMNITRTNTEGGKTQSDIGFQQGINAFKRGEGDLEAMHHTTALGGDVMLDEEGNPKLDSRGRPMMKSREAASAGFVKFNFQGQMISISNSSGHYKPSVSMLLQAVEHLTKQGAFFEDEITDANGDEVEPDSKPGQLFAAVQAKLKQKAPLLQQAQAKTAELAEATDEQEQERLGREIEALGKQLETLSAELEAPTKILGKLGIGPSRRMRQDAEVEIGEVKAGMTGGDVRTMQTTTMQADEFLKSGGNVEQLERKKTMLEELEEKTAGKRETLDRMAEVRSARVERTTGGGGTAPSEDDVEEALNALNSKPPAQDGGGGAEEEEREETGDREEGGESSETGASGSNPYLEQNRAGYETTLDLKESGKNPYLPQNGDVAEPEGRQEEEDQEEGDKDGPSNPYLEQNRAGYEKSPI